MCSCRPQVEKLLAQIEAEGGAPGSGTTQAGALDARARMFERLASEVARLNFYSARGKVRTLPTEVACRRARMKSAWQGIA